MKGVLMVLAFLMIACEDEPIPNSPPEAATIIPDHTLDRGADSTFSLLPHFTDSDGDTLSYDVVSRDPKTVSVSVQGSLLTLTSGYTGSSEIEVRAFDPDSTQAVQTFEVTAC